MVLAAGLGTRFRPLSDLLPKPAAPVVGEPLVRRTLRYLHAQGVREAVVNTHYRPEAVRDACAALPGVRVRFQHEPEILGTGGAVHQASAFLGKGTALLCNGDMVFDFDLGAALAFHRERGALATMILRRAPDVKRYGAVEIDGRGQVVRLLGQPASRKPGRARMFTGVHLLEPAFYRELVAQPSCIVRTAYRSLIDRGAPVYGFESDARWLDIGTPADYLHANLTLLGERVHLAPAAVLGAGARVTRSVVGDGAVVGQGAVVADCVLWPGARVAAGARVVGEVILPANEAELLAGRARAAAAQGSFHAGAHQERACF